MTTTNQPTKVASISEGDISHMSQISGGSAWMNVSLMEGLMEVYKSLTFTAQEIRWVYARGYTNINAIVKCACSSTNQIKNVITKEKANNNEYHDMIVKIIIIGRYFFQQVFPDYEHHELSVKTNDFPIKDEEMSQFLERFFDTNDLRIFARNHYGEIHDEVMDIVQEITGDDQPTTSYKHDEKPPINEIEAISLPLKEDASLLSANTGQNTINDLEPESSKMLIYSKNDSSKSKA